jgi:cytochrome c-type biogenesis protein CcmE
MKNIRYLAGGVTIGVAMIALVAGGMRNATMSSVPVDKVRAADGTTKSFVGQRLRVVGFVAHSPLRRQPVQTEAGTVDVAHFEVEDKGRVMQVVFRDALPDTFRAGGPVQVDGRYVAPGKIEADHVLTKCPSKYEAVKPAPKKESAKTAPV